MLLKISKISVKTIYVILLMTCIFLSAAVFWIVSEPRSLDSLTPYIENEINQSSSKYKVDIGKTYIGWNSAKRAFSIDLKDVSLLSDQEQSLANFPKASFDFSIFRLLRGKILSSDVTLYEPSFRIDISTLQNKDNKSDGSGKKELLKKIYNSFETDNINLPINSLIIKDAVIIVDNGSSEFAWKVQSSRIRIDNLGKEHRLISESVIDLNSYKTTFHTDASLSDDMLSIKIGFESLPSNILTDIFPEKEILKNISIVSDGSIDTLIDSEGVLSQAILNLRNAKGKFDVPDLFKQEIVIDNASIRGSVYNDLSNLTIDKINIELGGGQINGSAIIGIEDIASPSIDMDVEILDIKTDDLDKYWPIGLGEKARNWVTESIKGGVVKKAVGKFKFSSADILSLKEWKKDKKYNIPAPIPDGAIWSSIDVEGAEVSYNANLPKITDAVANVVITAKDLKVNGKSAKILESNISDVDLEIPDFWQRPMRLNISGKFDATNQDALVFLKKTAKNIEKTQAIKSIYESAGFANGDLMLKMPIKKSLKYDEIDLLIDANFKKTNFKNFLNDNDFVDSEFNLKLNKYSLHIDGNTNSLGSKFNFVFDKDFSKQSKYKARYQVKSSVNADVLKKLGVADLPYIENNFYVNTTITEYEKYKNITGVADIKNAKVVVDKIGFSKEQGVDGKVNFKVVQEENMPLKIEEFSIKGEEFSASGKMIINGETKNIESLSVSNVKFDGNNISLKYSENKDGVSIDASGKSLDLSDVPFSKLFEDNGEGGRKAIKVNAKFDNIILKNSESFSEFKLDLDCGTDECLSVNLYAKMNGDKFIAGSLKPLGDRSSLRVESDDAGTVIKALGISRHIRSGSLTLNSTFAKRDGKTIAQGEIQIFDFLAVKTPTLGKLLTLASLKGITDILDNKGISFKKFSAPFTLANGVISVKDAKSSGSSIGITAEGDININKSELNLKGLIIPAHAVNQMLERIPVVGTLLTGGKDEGFIATKYKITGPYENVKVSVNPFTILTPGILRNVFDILPGGN